jgi:hypothetical protein
MPTAADSRFGVARLASSGGVGGLLSPKRVGEMSMGARRVPLASEGRCIP